jgi:hypothetical protein
MPKGVYPRTKQHCKNISKAKLGTKLSEEHKRKISETKKAQFRKLLEGGI